MENTVTLPAFVIASLYKDSLIEPAEPTTISGSNILEKAIVENSADTIAKAYLGGNKQQITIVVKEETERFINNEALTFLSNILSACGFSLDDIAVFNQLKNPVVFSEVKENLGSRYFLLFGVEPSEVNMPFQIPNFQVQQYAGAAIVVAPALQQMNQQNAAAIALKRQLWESLQRCFDIKKPSKSNS